MQRGLLIYTFPLVSFGGFRVLSPDRLPSCPYNTFCCIIPARPSELPWTTVTIIFYPANNRAVVVVPRCVYYFFFVSFMRFFYVTACTGIASRHSGNRFSKTFADSHCFSVIPSRGHTCVFAIILPSGRLTKRKSALSAAPARLCLRVITVIITIGVPENLDIRILSLSTRYCTNRVLFKVLKNYQNGDGFRLRRFDFIILEFPVRFSP